ncbi:MAG: hypothetical protein CMG62_00880 [Candidatus Marinimicrobia bacterium]|nr:hypothetical protein [Candidatus Neomarinimicrobiota bacterium]|tara:strand:- start:3714 stop:4382 length:669 start_codon:yes stop_codon:yes gene_type:complete
MKIALVLLIFLNFLLGSSKVAVAIKIKGKVSLISSRDKNKTGLKPGTPLNDKDKIITDKDSFAALMYLDDKSVIKLLSNSDLIIIGERSKKGINKSLDISYGKITANIAKQKGNEFRIATPTSVASVKGTELAITSDPSDGDSFTLLEGLIEVTNSITGESMEVSQGETAVSTPDGSLDVSETTTEDMEGFDEAEVDIPAQELRFEVEDTNGNIKEIIIRYR